MKLSEKQLVVISELNNAILSEDAIRSITTGGHFVLEKNGSILGAVDNMVFNTIPEKWLTYDNIAFATEEAINQGASVISLNQAIKLYRVFLIDTYSKLIEFTINNPDSIK